MRITKKSLFIDERQGLDMHGKAFGFIGTSATDEYRGWFFTWPGKTAAIASVAEREAVIDSLETDETCPNDSPIPFRFARQILEKRLKAKFDLRRRFVPDRSRWSS